MNEGAAKCVEPPGVRNTLNAVAGSVGAIGDHIDDSVDALGNGDEYGAAKVGRAGGAAADGRLARKETRRLSLTVGSVVPGLTKQSLLLSSRHRPRLNGDVKSIDGNMSTATWAWPSVQQRAGSQFRGGSQRRGHHQSDIHSRVYIGCPRHGPGYHTGFDTDCTSIRRADNLRKEHIGSGAEVTCRQGVPYLRRRPIV